jgi:hypothetical protein
MLLQTNSYIVPREKRVEHARLLRRFRQILLRLGCDHFEVYEQTGANWSSGDNSGRFVQIMRFRDRKQQLAVQNAERTDPAAQAILKEFVDLVNLPYQQQQGLFAVGFYTSFMRMPEVRHQEPGSQPEQSTEPPAQTDTGGDGQNSMQADSIPMPSTDEDSSSNEDSISSENPTTNEESAGDSIPDGIDLNPDHGGNGAEPLDPQSAFQSDDESDFSDSGHLPNLSDDENEQAENPTFPSSS